MDLQGAQGTGLPASPYLDTTPTSEVLVRIRTENARMLKENRQSIDFTRMTPGRDWIMFIKVNVQTWLLVLLKIETSHHMLSQRQLDING
jgi:hypothetical protein